MGIPETVMLFMAAVALAVSLNHLFLALKISDSVQQFAIFLSGLTGFSYFMILYYGYQAEPDLEILSRIYRYHLLLMQAAFLSLLWSYSILINSLSRSWSVIMLVSFFILMALTIVLPHNILYSHSLTVTYSMVLGSQTVLLSNGLTVWRLLADLTVVVTVFFCLTIAFRHLMIQGSKIHTILMVVAGVFVLTGIVDHLTDSGDINFFYLLPVGYLISFGILSTLSLEHLVKDLKGKEDLAIEERKWRLMIEEMKLLVVELNTLGQIKYVNPFFLQFTGYREEELKGMDWFELLLPANYSYDVQSAFLEILSNDFHPQYQNPIITKYQEEKLISWFNVRLRNTKGKITGSISIGVDITKMIEDQEHLEQALSDAKTLIKKLEKK